MSATTSAPPLPVIDPDVLRLALAMGVGEQLPEMLDRARAIFPEARRIKVTVEQDPDIAGECRIVIDVETALEVEEALEAKRRWNDAVLAMARPLQASLFSLSMNLVD